MTENYHQESTEHAAGLHCRTLIKFQVIYRIFPKTVRKTTKRYVNLTGSRDEAWTRDFPNTKHSCNHYRHFNLVFMRLCVWLILYRITASVLCQTMIMMDIKGLSKQNAITLVKSLQPRGIVFCTYEVSEAHLAQFQKCVSVVWKLHECYLFTYTQRERLVNLGPPERGWQRTAATIMQTTLSNLHISVVRRKITLTFLQKYSRMWQT